MKYKVIKQEDMSVAMKQHGGCLTFHYPTVTHLAVHLENGQRVFFNENTFQDWILSPP